MKKIIVGILTLAMAMVLCMISAKAVKADETYEINFQVQPAEGSIQATLADAFAEKIEELTDGAVKVKVYYSGTLYGQDVELESVFIGDLDMALTAATWLAQYCEDVPMFGSAFFFNDYEQMTNYLNGESGQQLWDKIAEGCNGRVLGAGYIGARQITTTTTDPIMTPADMNGLIMRMPGGAAQFMGKALGATPTELSMGEIYTALQFGTIDGQDNSLSTTASFSWDEVLKQVSLTYHQIDSIWPIINLDLWNSMSEDLQAKMLEAMKYAISVSDEMAVSTEQDLIEQFRDEGIIITEPDREAFKEYAINAYVEEYGDTWDMDLYYSIVNPEEKGE